MSNAQLFETVIYNTPKPPMLSKDAQFIGNFKTNNLNVICSFTKGQLKSQEGRNHLVKSSEALGLLEDFRALMIIVTAVYTLIKLDEYGANMASL